MTSANKLQEVLKLLLSIVPPVKNCYIERSS